jgi:transposase
MLPWTSTKGVILPARFFQARGGWKDLETKRLPEYLGPLLATMKGVYEQLTRAIRQVGTTLKQREHNDERLARLETIPGVGTVSALTLVADSGRYRHRRTDDRMELNLSVGHAV